MLLNYNELLQDFLTLLSFLSEFSVVWVPWVLLVPSFPCQVHLGVSSWDSHPRPVRLGHRQGPWFRRDLHHGAEMKRSRPLVNRAKCRSEKQHSAGFHARSLFICLMHLSNIRLGWFESQHFVRRSVNKCVLCIAEARLTMIIISKEEKVNISCVTEKA